MRSFSETMVLLASGVAAAMSLGSVAGVSLPGLFAVVMQWRQGRRGSGDLDGHFGAAVKQLQAELDQSPEFGGLDWGIVEAAFEQLGKVDLSSDDIIAAISADNSADEAEVVSNYVANKIDWADHNDRYQRGFKFAFKVAYDQVLASPEFKQNRVYVFAKELLASQSKNQLEQLRQHRQVIQLLNELLDRRESLDLDRKYDWSVASKTDYLAMTFSARGTEFVGREQERQRLRELLDDEREIVWWQIAGKAGQGKSRLALDFVDSLDDGVWHAGFLSWDQLSEVNWKSIDFLRPTLIIIDYIANQQKAQAFIKALRSLKTREHKSLHHKVRFLLLEREAYKLGSDNNGLVNWLSPLLKKSDNLQALQQYCFDGQALELPDLSTADMKAIINSWRSYQEKPALSEDELSKIIQKLRGGSARTRAWRPLFAILFASLGVAGLETETPLSIEDILNRALNDEEANFWSIEGEPLKQAVCLACLATMLGQIDLKKLKELDVSKELYFDEAQQDEIIRQAHCLLGRALAPTVDQPNYTLQAREPDLLGECLVIRYLGRLLNALEDRSEQFTNFIQDAWRYDFQSDYGIKILLFPDFLQRLNQDFNDHEVARRIGATLPSEAELAIVKQWGELAWVACGLSAVIRQHESAEQSDKDRLLVLAADVGNMTIVNLAFEQGAVANCVYAATGAFPLLVAAQNGHIGVVRILLERGATPDQTHNTGTFPLLRAAQNGHAEIVRLLLEQGASSDQVNKNTGTFPLLMAADQGHTEVVRLLLGRGATFDQVHTSTGISPLFKAVINGHTEVVRLLLGRGAMPDNINEKDGSFPLLMPAMQGHADVVRLLLEQGANPDQMHDTGLFPLYGAAMYGHTEVVRLLLELGATPDQVNKKDGFSPLFMALVQGHGEVVKLLLERGASPDQAHAHTGVFPLLIAAENGHTEVVILLLGLGANPSQANEKDDTFPLLQAAQNGHAQAVKILLEWGASLDQTDISNGNFPLLQAAGNGHAEVVKILLERGATPDQVNEKDGRFPLLLAAQNGHVEAVKLLLERGTIPDQTHEKNVPSPLLQAAQNGHEEVVKLLLGRGAIPDQIYVNTGAFPLLLAAQDGHVEVVKLLLEQGAKPDQIHATTGVFPLFVSAMQGHAEVVKILLERGAKPDQIHATTGVFPLFVSAMQGHAEVVKILLERGINPDQVNTNDGTFPLLLAAQKGHVDSVRLLLRKGATPNKVYGRTGESPLALALQYGHTEVARLLILAGSVVTPKMLADYRGNAAIVELLRKSKNKPGSKPTKP